MLQLKQVGAWVLALLSLGGTVQASQPGANSELVHQGTPHDIVYGIAARPTELMAVGTGGIFLRSRDGGSWELERLATGGRALFAVATSADVSLTVGQQGLIMRNSHASSDAKHWQPVESHTEQRLFSVAMDIAGNAAAVGGFGTLLVSQDSGNSWKSQPVDWEALVAQPYEPHIYKVVFDSQGRLLMSGEFGMIARSSDLGKNWVLLRKGDASVFDLALRGSHEILAVGQNGEVTHSVDAGANWTQLSTDTNGVLLDALVTDDDSDLIVFGLRENLFRKHNAKTDLAILGTENALGSAWYTDSVSYQDAHYVVGQFGRIVKIRK